MTPENALISRRVVHSNSEQVVIEERWDLDHPDSPFVRFNRMANPYQSAHIRQFVLAPAEYDELKLPLK
jgi:hypothetical protein